MQQEYTPPQWPSRLLRWFCSNERVEELEGDLHEVYNHFIAENGTRFAGLFYWWIVCRSFRFYAFRKQNKTQNRMNYFVTLLRHHLLIASRDILRNKVLSTINVLGLALGLASFLGIYQLVQFELSFNRHIPQGDRIYRIYTKFTGSMEATNRGVSMKVADYARETLTGTENLVHFLNPRASSIKIEQADGTPKIMGRRLPVVLADPDYFELIDEYTWLAGSPKLALSEPYRVVLTNEQAIKYFESDDWEEVIGQEVIYWDSIRTVVSGIVKKSDLRSDFKFTDFVSKASLKHSWLANRYSADYWDSTNSYSQFFLKANSQVTRNALETQLQLLSDHVNTHMEEDWQQHYLLQPLEELHFGTDLGIFDRSAPPAHLPTLLILLAVAAGILLMAMFNFVNLETAIAAYKHKEVSVRRVMGSSKSQILCRFLTQGIVQALLAAVLVPLILYIGLNFFKEFISQQFQIEYLSFQFMANLVGLSLLVGLLSGFYPAWLIARKQNLMMLKPIGDTNSAGVSWARRALIFFQFSFSQWLILGTIAVVWQISFMLEKDLGIEQDRIVSFNLPYSAGTDPRSVLFQKLGSLPSLEKIVQQQSPAITRGWSMNFISLDTTEAPILAHRKESDSTFLDFYDIPLLTGRPIIPSPNSNEILINETLSKRLGLDPEEAVGTRINYEGDRYVVSGVMQDFHVRSLHYPLEPMFLVYGDEGYSCSVKISKNADLTEAIASISTLWDEVYPDHPLDMVFMDETIERFYQTEQRTSKVASLATAISILISCMGLFGLITYATIQRSKEMGVRKILGAKVVQIAMLLSRELIVLLCLAFLLAVPAAELMIGQWSSDFAYNPKMGMWLYFAGLGLSLLVASAAVITKVIAAARSNPIDSLRYE